MKKLLSIFALVLLFGCSDDDEPQPQHPQVNQYQNPLVLIIARSFVDAGGEAHIDTILPTSYWGRNGQYKNIPALSVLHDSTLISAPGFERFQDTIDAAQGDIITISLNFTPRNDTLNHPGTFIGFVYNGTVLTSLSRFMCVGDTVSQTGNDYPVIRCPAVAK